MIRVNVGRIARAEEVPIMRLHAAINMGRMASGRPLVAATTIRRYWYGTKDARPGGEPITEVDLGVLEEIADVLGCSVFSLLEHEHLGPLAEASYASGVVAG